MLLARPQCWGVATSPSCASRFARIGLDAVDRIWGGLEVNPTWGETYASATPCETWMCGRITIFTGEARSTTK